MQAKRTRAIVASVAALALVTGWVLLRGGEDRVGDASTGAERPLPSTSCPGCNLLLVSIDTLRADRLGSYGNPRPTSPHIDALAARSFVFRDVLAQAPTTFQSHASLFSGLYVFQHKNKLHRVPVMSELLAAQGYRTAAFVDGAQMGKKFGMDKGFETFFDTGAPHQKGAQRGGGLSVINPQVVGWLEAHARERFFVFVHTYDVHCPYTPPEPWRSMFTAGYEPAFEVQGKCGMAYFNSLDLQPRDFEYIRALYDGGIRYTDERLQEILSAIGRLGLASETVVVVTSDHGESLGERGLVGHNRVQDIQLKIPLIIHHPSGQHAVVEQPVQSIDILPTLLEMLEIEAPEALPGVDLMRPAAPAETPGRRTRFAENIFGTRGSIRVDKRWSLIVAQGEAAELHDLEQDPSEETNLLEREPAMAAELVDAFRGLRVPAEQRAAYPEDLDESTIEQLRALGYTP